MIGWRTGPREVLEALGDPTRADSVPPTMYKFLLYVNLETGDDRYRFVNTGMWVGSGMRKGAQGEIYHRKRRKKSRKGRLLMVQPVIYDAYQL